MISSNIYTIYGLYGFNDVIDKIVEEIDAQRISFDLKMMITEGVSNAFYHGNCGRMDLPIYIRYQYDGIILNIEIEDSGDGIDETKLGERISSDNLLQDNGRGMYLIKCYSDDITVNWNKLIIKKIFIK
jgi:serine/threonine-protein kinase RsbW